MAELYAARAVVVERVDELLVAVEEPRVVGVARVRNGVMPEHQCQRGVRRVADLRFDERQFSGSSPACLRTGTTG